MARCASRNCLAEIIWVPTQTGRKKMPLDAQQTDQGNVILEHDLLGEQYAVVLGPNTPRPDDKPIYMPHWATCPDRDRWKEQV